MGLIISVYRDLSNYDCTNGGISGQYTELTLVNVDGPFEPKSERPAALLVQGNLPGTVKIVSAVLTETGYKPVTYSDRTGPMMGGNYGATSDSRFSEAVESLLGHRFYGAVAIHDRFE